ncbi:MULTISPECIES: hypothetical protein [Ferrimicrobium]|nr:hypothetical protein [Ferrimicrobium sp.]
MSPRGGRQRSENSAFEEDLATEVIDIRVHNTTPTTPCDFPQE